jgi:hypothetical protein
MKKFDAIYQYLFEQQTSEVVAIFLHKAYADNVYEIDTYNGVTLTNTSDIFWHDDEHFDLYHATNLKDAIEMIERYTGSKVRVYTNTRTVISVISDEIYKLLISFEASVDEWRIHYSGDMLAIMGKLDILKQTKNMLHTDEDDISDW